MEASQVYENKTLAILLIAASVVLLSNGIFSMEQFSIQYGVGAGALLQSSAYNLTVAPLLRGASLQIQTLYRSILESALLTGLGFVMFVMALVLLIHSPGRYGSYLRRYVPVHIMLAVVYIVVMVIVQSAVSIPLSPLYIYLTYIAVGISIFFDIYLEYDARRHAARRFGRDININPQTPFANMMNLRAQLFDLLSGDIGLVDRHFNSAAMSNLYRLLPMDGDTKVKSMKIVTSEEMLDSKFRNNYFDLKEELKNSGIGFELRVMRGEDATAQHERFIIDENGAYKIPPMNIINKKSEHITRMNARDAKKRFDYLCQNSIKYENYLDKQSRKDSSPSQGLEMPG